MNTRTVPKVYYQLIKIKDYVLKHQDDVKDKEYMIILLACLNDKIAFLRNEYVDVLCEHDTVTFMNELNDDENTIKEVLECTTY